MARAARTDTEGAIHHVYTRGTKRWALFHDDVDRRRFMGTLSMVTQRYRLALLAYCLMDNHMHLVVQCPDAGLSAAMRDLKSMYARWFNERHRSSGPIFEDRFGSKPVTSYAQLRSVVMYVHRNPYSIDPSMVLASYQWSSHGAYLGAAPCPVWLKPDVVKPYFGDYRSDVETPRQTDAVQNSEAVPGTASLAPMAPAVADVVIAVARAGGVEICDVAPTIRNGLVGLAVIIAMDDLGFSATEILEPMGYRTAKAVHSARRRAHARVLGDAGLAATLFRARVRVLPSAA